MYLLFKFILCFTDEDKERDLRDRERARLEEEVRELRTRLTKSASVLGDFSDTRKELDRSERQKQQLSDHIEVGTVHT